MTEETKEKKNVEKAMVLDGRDLTAVTEEEVNNMGLKKVGNFKCTYYTHCRLGIKKRFKGREEIEYYNEDYPKKGEIILYSK